MQEGKLILRILLAALFSPVWLPAYLFLVAVTVVSAILVNLVIFIVKGEWDKEIMLAPIEVATLKLFRGSAQKEGNGQ